MAILINNDGSGSQEWVDHLQPHLPEHTLYCFEQLDDTDAIVDDIEYALVWNHPAGELQRYSNLKAILILGAGTEHIDHDATVPRVPIVRLVDPEMSRDMAQYALYWVMNTSATTTPIASSNCSSIGNATQRRPRVTSTCSSLAWARSARPLPRFSN